VTLVIPTISYAGTIDLFFDSRIAQIKFAVVNIKTALESKLHF